MGMSASQARLLSLTSRITDLELKAQSISNSKIRLADESEAASRNYNDALNKQKLTIYAGVNDNGVPQYMDATAYNLTTYGEVPNQTTQRMLKDSYGRVMLTEKAGTAYINSQDNGTGFEGFLNGMGYTLITSESIATNAKNSYYSELYSDVGAAKTYINVSDDNGFETSYKDSDIITATGSIGLTAYNEDQHVLASDSHGNGGWWQSNPGSSVNDQGIISAFTTYLTDIHTKLSKSLKSALEGTVLGSDSDLELTAACNFAYTATLNKILYNVDDTDSTDNSTGVSGTPAVVRHNGNSTDNNGIFVNTSTSSGGVCNSNSDSTTKVTVDTSQVVDTYLSYFDRYCAQHFGGTSSSTIGGNKTTRGTNATSGKNGTGAANKEYARVTDRNALDALIQKINAEAGEINTTFNINTGISLSTDFTSNSLLALLNTLNTIPLDTIKSQIDAATINPDSEAGQEIAYNNTLTYDPTATDYYGNVYDQVQENGAMVIDDENMKNPDWLYAQLNAGNLFLYEKSKDGEGTEEDGGFVNTPWKTGDPNLKLETDATDVAKAESQYQTTMADIQSKDKRFDLQLKEIDTEHNAIQTEVDSVKKVIDKNIEKSFKTFDA